MKIIRMKMPSTHELPFKECNEKMIMKLIKNSAYGIQFAKTPVTQDDIDRLRAILKERVRLWGSIDEKE